jgi:hypothetical protein
MCAGHSCAKCSAAAGVRRATAAPREAAHHHPAAARRPAAGPGLCAATAAAAAGPAPRAALLGHGWARACLEGCCHVVCFCIFSHGGDRMSMTVAHESVAVDRALSKVVHCLSVNGRIEEPVKVTRHGDTSAFPPNAKPFTLAALDCNVGGLWPTSRKVPFHLRTGTATRRWPSM